LSWTTAGFPADQILLGLPSYGYVSRSTAENLRSRRRSLTNAFIPSNPVYQPPANGFRKNLRSRDVAAADFTGYGGVVTVTSEAGSADSGQVQFNALISQGALVTNAPGASPAFVGAGGFEREWDACSSTVSQSLDISKFLSRPEGSD
jgi:chitinase